MESNRSRLPAREYHCRSVFAQAARTPDAIALISHGRSLTYRRLDESANRLARHLQGLGVKPDTLVGVAMGRSETLVVSLLGILKAGGAYVPLDPTYPQDRLSLMIEDSEMPVLLTTADSRAHLPLASGSLTVLDAEDPAIARESPLPVASAATPANLAYVIYTSGSTGKPKGVMVENRNVVNFFTGMDRAYRLQSPASGWPSPASLLTSRFSSCSGP